MQEPQTFQSPRNGRRSRPLHQFQHDRTTEVGLHHVDRASSCQMANPAVASRHAGNPECTFAPAGIYDARTVTLRPRDFIIPGVSRESSISWPKMLVIFSIRFDSRTGLQINVKLGKTGAIDNLVDAVLRAWWSDRANLVPPSPRQQVRRTSELA